ncbi:MAG: MauE/DoxX family redox-associated membrane protein [Acidobacteriota bacterium]|jgi:uncharacterized membrane protein YphA (DoxX/SURF4 family)
MTTTLRIIHWICRCLLAGVFIYSGYVKAKATLQFAVAITGYQIVPEQYIYPIAKYFPWVEIALGLILLSGLKIRWSSIAAAGLMMFFIVLLSITLYRGIDTNCGCFGFGDRITWKTLLRDGSFFVPAMYLVIESWWPKRSKTSRLAETPA